MLKEKYDFPGANFEIGSIKLIKEDEGALNSIETDCYTKSSTNLCCVTGGDNSSSCGCNGSIGCSESVENDLFPKAEFDITIDGTKVTVSDSSKNIVEIAKSAGVIIPAPCFFAKKKNGCCKVCLVEIDAKESYACGIKAKEGMDIVVNREDLKAKRRERLVKYKENVVNEGSLQCDIKSK